MKRMWVLFGCVLFAAVLVLTACGCKHPDTIVIDASEPTCQAEGYTGDTFCPKCEKIVEEGEVIERLPHNPGERVEAVEPTCTEDGYTGDVYCLDCEEMVESGEVVPALGHAEGALADAVDATCTEDGYTGDVFCERCGEQLVAGEVIPATGHGETEVRDAADPTCAAEGYTGDTYCTVCGEMIEQGEAIERLAHTPGEAYGEVDATCLTEGYTGDRDCEVCGETVPGEAIPRTDHAFAEGVCEICGWREPGLYMFDQLTLSWEEMEAMGYVDVQDGVLLSTAGDYSMGTLVIGEDVNAIDGSSGNGFKGTNAAEVWIPRTVTRLGSYLLNHNTWVRDVVLYCQIDAIPESCFANSTALERVALPETVQVIGSNAFDSCESLREINLPEGLTDIGEEAFFYSGIEEVALPATLERIGARAFGATGLTHIELPASVAELGPELFAGSRSLVSADMSACEELGPVLAYGMFKDCVSLAEVKLPPRLESFHAGYSTFEGYDRLALTELALPDGLYRLGEEHFGSVALERIVWPVSLTDAGSLVSCPLKEIYYRGTEEQWNEVIGHDAFPDAEVVFNFDGAL